MSCHGVRISPESTLLSILRYVLLTGVHPFDLDNNSSNEEMEHLIVSGKTPPIRNSEFTAGLSEDALSVLERLMDRDPQRRPSAKELLGDPWIKGETASTTIISGSDRRLKEYQVSKQTDSFSGFQLYRSTS